MNTKALRTVAEINERQRAIGAELAKGGLRPVANARELERESAMLKVELLAAEQREGEEKLIAERTARALRQREAQDRRARIEKAVAEATR